MGDAEYRDWQRYYSVEPFGPPRDNMHAGVVAAAVLAPHTKRGKKPPTYKDFMLKDPATAQDERRGQTSRTLATLKAMARKK